MKFNKLLKNKFLGCISFITLFVSGCDLTLNDHSLPKVSGALSEDDFVEKYSGVYVLNKDIRDFIIDNEDKREKQRAILKEQAKNLSEDEREALYSQKSVDILYPRKILSDCTYYWDRADEKQYFRGYYSLVPDSPEYKIIKTHLGDANFKKYESGIVVTSYVKCYKDYYALTVVVGVKSKEREFGLKGDSGMGFSLWRDSIIFTGFKDRLYEYTNGKFELK